MTEPVKSTRINGVQYNYPICHRCGVQVQAFTWCDHADQISEQVALTVVGDASVAPVVRTFFALCHGETDTVSISLEELTRAKGSGWARHFCPRLSILLELSKFFRLSRYYRGHPDFQGRKSQTIS